jgi:ribose-phosphate pyrophosphokinase
MINKYPDGTSYAIVKNIEEDFITAKINNYEELWHLNQYVDAYNHACNIKPNILIPNLIDAQADRRFNSNESSGLKLVCKFLNSMNANFKIFHPHNPEVVEALIDKVEIIDNSEFIHNVLHNIIKKKFGEKYDSFQKQAIINNTILMSSDAGGFKPLMKLCDKISWQGETASASKYRECKDGKSILTQLIAHNDFRGKDILIVDDICVYGGTFKGLSKMLKERNCGKLYLAVSHMTVQNLGEDPVTNYFDTVFTTNSKYDQYFTSHGAEDQSKLQNLEIIKLF